MNILVLTPLTPLKQESGLQTRIWNIWRRISKHHKVTMICYDFDIENMIIKNEGNIKLFLLPVNNSKITKIIMLLTSAIYGLPSAFFKLNTNLLFNLAKSIIEEEEFDMLVSDHLWLSPPLLKIRQEISNLPTLFISHGFEWVTHKRLAEIESFSLLSLFHKISARNLKEKELKICKNFDFCCCISNEEKDFLIRNGFKKEKIAVIPNGVDISYHKPTFLYDDQKENPSIVFLGLLSYIANSDGLEWHIKNIYPSVKEHCKNTKFYIIGKNPPDWLTKISVVDKTISLTGYVNDLGEFLSADSVCISPLRIGGGSRIKILEYFAYSKPVISTSIGAEGLDVTHKKNIIIADDPKEFGEWIIKLINDSELRGKLGRNGRRLVEEKYDWEVISRKLERVIGEINKYEKH